MEISDGKNTSDFGNEQYPPKYPWRSGWIGVDLDGTLAHYDGYKGPDHIGQPIEEMVNRVRGWINDGYEVRVFTARVAGKPSETFTPKLLIEEWCLKHIGRVLAVTCIKDHKMYQLWDDRAIQVIPNTGEPVEQWQGGEHFCEKLGATVLLEEEHCQVCIAREIAQREYFENLQKEAK